MISLKPAPILRECTVYDNLWSDDSPVVAEVNYTILYGGDVLDLGNIELKIYGAKADIDELSHDNRKKLMSTIWDVIQCHAVGDYTHWALKKRSV